MIPEDVELVASYVEIDEIQGVAPQPLSPWMLRFVMEKTAMVERSVAMKDIELKIEAAMPDVFQIMRSDDNAENLVVRLRQRVDEAEKDMVDTGGEGEDVELRKSAAFLTKTYIIYLLILQNAHLIF